MLNNVEERKKIVNVKNSFINNDTYPLEMEYNFINQSKSVRFPKGRIDNVLIEKNIVNFVEIKIGTAVIAGTNGIHKHLIDMLYAIKYDVISASEIDTIVKNRDKLLKKYNIQSTISSDINLDTIEYNIVCGYKDETEKNKVKALIDKIYNMSFKDELKLTKSGKESESKSIKELIEKYKTKYGKLDDKELIDYTIDDYIKSLNKVGCITKIYLANEDFTEVEEYE